MTLKHLRIFWTVCKYQSITVAAEHLNMLQPAVSVSIRELEAFYNVKLFERMNRRIYMTDSGAALLKYANRILADFEESVDVLRNTKMPVSLRVGANTTVSASILPDVLKVYAKKNPNIHLTSMVDDTAAIETQLLKNELDLAMIDNISASPHFVSRSIMQDEMIAVCSRRYMPVPEEPFSLKKLSREKLLLREKGSGTRDRHGVCLPWYFHFPHHGKRQRPCAFGGGAERSRHHHFIPSVFGEGFKEQNALRNPPPQCDLYAKLLSHLSQKQACDRRHGAVFLCRGADYRHAGRIRLKLTRILHKNCCILKKRMI